MSDRFPWFPFYTADWLTSPAIVSMSAEQRGGYVQLLAYAWNGGNDEPSLPDDDRQLAILSGLGRRWARHGGPVRARFSPRAAVPGRLFDDKLSQVYEVQRSKQELQSAAGRASAIARTERQRRSNGASTERQRSAQQNSTSQSQSQTQSQSQKKQSTSDPTPIGALVARTIGAAVRRP